jgi:hypothetical protein
MDDNENNPKGVPSKYDVMLALTTVFNKDYDFLDDVNRITFGLISKRNKQNANPRSNHRRTSF